MKADGSWQEEATIGTCLLYQHQQVVCLSGRGNISQRVLLNLRWAGSTFPIHPEVLSIIIHLTTMLYTWLNGLPSALLSGRSTQQLTVTDTECYYLHTKLLHLTALGRGVVSSSCHWAENLRLGPALFPASDTTRWASHFISLWLGLPLYKVDIIMYILLG